MLLVLLLALTALVGAAAGLVRYCIVFPRQPFKQSLPGLTAGDLDLAHRLQTHVRAVASHPHNVAHPEMLEAAAVYIEGEITAAGLTPVAQVYTVDNGIPVRNIEVVLEPPGVHAATPCYVIGAHYDAPDDCPGANDNGTGVAALLELMREMAKAPPRSARLRLVFFVNEEQPYGHSELMGSWQYAAKLAAADENVAGMIALETLGYFSDRPGSQRFPPPFGSIFPDTGNFVAFVALPGTRRFLHRSIKAFRKHAQFPSIGGLAPGFIEGIDLSDHWSFRQFGYPALMITDTAPFRNPYYHEPTDVPESVDYESLARITKGLVAMTRELVDGTP